MWYRNIHPSELPTWAYWLVVCSSLRSKAILELLPLHPLSIGISNLSTYILQIILLNGRSNLVKVSFSFFLSSTEFSMRLSKSHDWCFSTNLVIWPSVDLWLSNHCKAEWVFMSNILHTRTDGSFGFCWSIRELLLDLMGICSSNTILRMIRIKEAMTEKFSHFLLISWFWPILCFFNLSGSVANPSVYTTRPMKFIFCRRI